MTAWIPQPWYYCESCRMYFGYFWLLLGIAFIAFSIKDCYSWYKVAFHKKKQSDEESKQIQQAIITFFIGMVLVVYGLVKTLS